jgi:hypothetical protein
MNRLTLQEFVTKHTGKLPYIQAYRKNFAEDRQDKRREGSATNRCPVPTCPEPLWLADYEGFVKGYLTQCKLNNKQIV